MHESVTGAALGESCPGRCRYISVAGGVDDHLGSDCLPAGNALDHDAARRVSLHERGSSQGLVVDRHARRQGQLLESDLLLFAVEATLLADPEIALDLAVDLSCQLATPGNTPVVTVDAIGGGTAEIGQDFDQDNAGPGASSGDRRGDARCATTNDDHIGVLDDRDRHRFLAQRRTGLARVGTGENLGNAH